ncbi:cytochrome b5 domain-containing protein 1-like [Rana temporaria]|uniref:cytochrome b5 domain-containing protein 1-like n=1 Tax=Rana temporaria TaxID=8407 RepID=UPI001AACBB94|nr:cytochrome b5 domain-containing protein 1-like [Rana temporaria]
MSPARAQFFTPREVSCHCTTADLWVSYLGRVYDLTPLAPHYKGDILLKPIIEAAGKDIGHWFNPKTGDIKTSIDPQTGCLRYSTPQGLFLHISPSYPCSDWDTDFGHSWWCDEIGILSAKTRTIRIINTLTSQEHTLEVCSEETIWEILRRYLPYIAHAASYTWKYCGVPLNMDLTEENGVKDDDEFEELKLDSDLCTASIHLYFNDDLTEL